LPGRFKFTPDADGTSLALPHVAQPAWPSHWHVHSHYCVMIAATVTVTMPPWPDSEARSLAVGGHETASEPRPGRSPRPDAILVH
jgi:hypothetical protein